MVKSSLLDLVISNQEKISFINQISVGFSDHDLLYFSYEILKPIEETKYFRDYKRCDVSKLLDCCQALKWDDIYHLNDIDSKVSLFNSHINYLYNKFVPLREIMISSSKPPWFSKEIANTIATRDYLYRCWKRHKVGSAWTEFKRIRNKVTNMIRNAKSQYYESNLNPTVSSKIFWSKIKKLGVGGASPFNLSNRFDADSLNTHFCSSNTGATTAIQSEECNAQADQNGFSFRNIDIHELSNAFNSIRSNAVGLDEIDIRFIRILYPGIWKILLHIVNTILSPCFRKYGNRLKLFQYQKLKTLLQYPTLDLLVLCQHFLKW